MNLIRDKKILAKKIKKGIYYDLFKVYDAIKLNRW